MKAFFARISKRNRIILGVVVAVIIVVVLIVNSQGNTNSNSAYQTSPVERGELIATVGATGTVRAIQSATLSWQIDGTVDQVNVKVGDFVKKGDVLATLDKSQLPQNIILAQSDLVTAQKALDEAISETASAQAAIDLQDAQDAYKKAYDYRVSLNGKQWIEQVRITYVNGQPVPVIKWLKGYPDEQTIQDADNDLALKKAKLDDAQRTYDRVGNGPNPADVAAAQAKVDASQATLNQASIIAPIDGVVTQALSLPGDVVGSQSAASALSSAASQTTTTGQTTASGQSASQGETAFRIDNLSGLLVDVQVSEVDINNVAVGQDVTLTLDAIANNADQQVKPGMTTAVNIIVKQVKDQLLVPNRAVRLVNDQRVVYILKNGQPLEVKITLGASSDTASAVNGGDLKEGDLLILNPPSQGGGPFGGGGGG